MSDDFNLPEDSAAVPAQTSLISAKDEIHLPTAVSLYIKTGSLAATARQLEVTVYELQKLAKTQRWTDEIGNLRRVEHAALDSALSEILGKALSGLVQRMNDGEECVTAEGIPYLKPVSAATLVRIADVIFDKRQLIRGLPTALTNESSKLGELAAKLEQLGRAQSLRTIDSSDAGGEPHESSDASPK